VEHPGRDRLKIVVDTGGRITIKAIPMKIPRNAISRAVITLIESGAKRATVFIDKNTVVSACRRLKPNKRARSVDIVLKLGQPNYREREFIADCVKSGEPLPVRKVQLKFYPKKKSRR
jgi:hypothetical protein